jgi:hypothetical protein
MSGALGGDATPWRELPPHRDEEQVKLDVDRSFVYYPNGKPFCQSKPAASLSPSAPRLILPQTTRKKN